MQELKIDLAPLQKRHVFIGVPAYGGLININFWMSTLALQRELTKFGIGHTFYSIGNESLIPRARNRVVAEALKLPHVTDLLFIDADIEFNPMDVVALLHFDRDIIGGAYPLKRIDWNQIRDAVRNNPDIPVDELPACGGEWSAYLHKDLQTKFEVFEPIPARLLATGFMLIKREVLESLQASRPTYCDHVADLTISDMFPIGINSIGHYESEDYSFCRLAAEAGFKIFVCPWMKLNHQGTYSFTGNMHLAYQHLQPVAKCTTT